ncbi:MAG TPA: response regulator [Gemmatimonadales bacterium]|nr:response regulator [Gemmatimonadales bacterium]
MTQNHDARIIVIDDEEPIRRLIRRVLESNGYSVFEASDGGAGLKLLAQEAADLVITDIFMPGEDGIVTLRRIRKEFPSTKVIVISGGDSTGALDMRDQAQSLGAVRTLGKPFTATELLRLVEGVLGGALS